MAALNTLTSSMYGITPRCEPDRPTCDRHADCIPCDPLIHSLAWVEMSTFHAWIDPGRRLCDGRRKRTDWRFCEHD